MRKSVMALWLTCVWLSGARANAAEPEKSLRAPIPAAARELVQRGVDLAARDQLPEALAAIGKAIALAPNCVNAHAEYIQIKANFLGRYDEVRAEYEALMAREPENPVYPMALSIASYQTSAASKARWEKRVVALAPEWAWAHYAKALLLVEDEPETAVAELREYIAQDGTWRPAYYTLAWIQEKTLKKLDDALVTAEMLTARPDFHTAGLAKLWSLRLGQAGGTAQAKATLRDELARLTLSTHDIELLDAARLAYDNLLKDKEAALNVERKIRQLDPHWYPERGKVIYIGTRNMSGVPRLVVAANHQYAIFNKIGELDEEMAPQERVARLQALLPLQPALEMKRYLYEQIFKAAAKGHDSAALIKYGAALYALDKTDVAIPATIAVVLADEKRALSSALRYAQLAEEATSVYRPMPRPANNGDTDAEWAQDRFPEQTQQQFYKSLRTRALDVHGWVLYRLGRYEQAEAKLRQAVALARTEKNLGHLAETLSKLGRTSEAERLAFEAKNEYAAALKRQFKNEPAKDFELVAIDGRRVKLSDLKGKVVVLDFWATWCGPCVKSVPTLVQLYEKYRARGLEILSITVDEQADLYKIAPFAKEYQIAYPVLLDAGAKELYNVKSFPTTIFIDRAGQVRYRDTGFSTETPRMWDTLVEQILQTK